MIRTIWYWLLNKILKGHIHLDYMSELDTVGLSKWRVEKPDKTEILS